MKSSRYPLAEHIFQYRDFQAGYVRRPEENPARTGFVRRTGKCVKRLGAFAKDVLDRRTWDNDGVNCVVSVLHYGFA